ncbi:LysR family transcriptional regulator [Sedimentimonas flavescens]|uniref:LysR family transcriptional regulator n=1 Tax=Sedimentimonas flavescens TaxID=2851012 RepID=A0ABT3A014_9RHOB|nr:LysR family transcriptional regulator [Sedimentimonas flavescens]MCV2879344.1 LysR family transcriptional regulator [Sedimentimonas flavescens]
MPQTDDAALSRRDLDWSDLAIILAIGRAGSLSGAARALGKTHSTIFRNITAIEEKTAVRFFDRFDTGYVPTDAGRLALQYAERVESEFHSMSREILGQDTRLSGRIRVTCPEVFASDHAPGLMARFMAEHPDIRVDVIPGHGAADLSRREAEVAIRATKAPPETTFGRKVCAFRFALYASPTYMERRADTPLAEHAFCLIEGTASWLVPVVWKSRQQGEDCAVFQCRASRAVQNAGAEGLGIAFLPCYVGDADPRLARVSDPLAHLDMQLWVLTHPDLRNTARVRAMMAFLYDTLGADADLWGGQRKSADRWNLLPREGWRR